MYLKILKQAIELQQNISFNYKNERERIGNPHAIYNSMNKDGIESMKVDIEQTSGYSSSKTPFPSFRGFNMKDITDVRLLDDKFKKSNDYNSTSNRYNNAIIKL